MFLDDELYQIAKSGDYNHWAVKSEISAKMILCVINRIIAENERISKDLKGSDVDLFVFIKRAKCHWYNIVKKLRKEGVNFLSDSSFEAIIEHHPLFEGFREELLKYLK